MKYRDDFGRVVLHVVNQDGQPYGSTRRCCSYCGLMVSREMAYVDTWGEWEKAADRCALLGKAS